MKKSLIALAVAGALAAPVAAMADTANVNIYGAANLSFDVMSTGTTTAGGVAGSGTSVNKVSSNASRIGLKGSEDLGGGTSAVWQVESLVAMDNAGGTFGTRNTFAGLSGESWGTALLGRHDTPYKIATRGLDVFADTIADNRSLMGGVGLTAAQLAAAAIPATGPLGASAGASFDGRQGDVVAYISPAMSGFTAAVAYVAGAEAATLSSQTKGSAWSLAGLYNAGPLNGSLAYEVHDFGTTTGTGTLGPITGAGLGNLANLKESAWKLGVGYTMDAFAVNFVYEKTTDNFGVGAADTNILGHSAYYLAGKFNVSASDAVKLAYTKSGDLNSMGVAALKANTGANQMSLGYDHSMSKRTTVYALYTRLNNSSAANYGLGNASFTTSTATNLGAGADPSAFSLGMKHTF